MIALISITPLGSDQELFSTRSIVIGLLLFVGVSSFGYQIHSDPKVTFGGTLLILGTECLKTAVFFILLDNLIAKNEKKQSEFEEAHSALMTGSWATAEEVNQLFDRVTKKDEISIALGRASNFSGLTLNLANRTFSDATWQSVILEGASIDDCEFNNLRFLNAAFSKAIVSDCDFIGCSFQNVDISDAVFVRCTFQSVGVETLIGRATFTDCTGHEVLAEAIPT